MTKKEKCEKNLYLKPCVAWGLSLSGLTAVIKRYYWRLSEGREDLKGGGSALETLLHCKAYTRRGFFFLLFF